jgi:putative ABC transport system permease protein
MVLASGLGIMGITLVLGVASGFDRYLELRKTETLNAFPIRVEKVSVVIPFFDEKYQPNLPVFSDVDVAYPRNIQYEFQTVNTLTEDYYEHVKGMDPSTYDHLHYDFGIEQQFAVINDGNIVDPLHTIQELDVNRTYIETNFDLLHGRLPSDDHMEAIIIVDRYNRLSKDVAQSIGFSGDSPINFDDLTALSLRWIPNDVIYSWNGSNYTKQAIDDLIDHDDVLPITIVGVFRIKEKFNLDYLRTGVYYMEHVGALMRENAESSSIVQAQLIQQTSVIDGSPLSTLQHENLLRDLGYATYPTSYTIYSSSFEQKDAIMRYLRSYNDAVSINDAIEPLDIAGIGLSTMRIAIESTTVILLVFSFLSLVISNLMIGIMTYTSVIERTKEIGILRAIGARKQDVGHIFYAETCVVGFFSGLFGVLLGYVLMPVINMILAGLTTIPNVSYLNPIWGLSLIILSILFTSLSGIVPARIASNKDPMLCLRNE